MVFGKINLIIGEKNLCKKLIIVLLLFIIIVVILKECNIYNYVLKQFYPTKYSEYVEQYSKEYNVDYLLIYSIIKAESNFNKNAVSSSDAKGLMQIMDSTADEFLESNEKNNFDILDPQTNIEIGIKYYAYLSNKYNGNMLLALTAYNAGIGNVSDWISSGIIKSDGSDIENVPFKETNMYVRKIINNYKIYQKLYQN